MRLWHEASWSDRAIFIVAMLGSFVFSCGMLYAVLSSYSESKPINHLGWQADCTAQVWLDQQAEANACWDFEVANTKICPYSVMVYMRDMTPREIEKYC